MSGDLRFADPPSRELLLRELRLQLTANEPGLRIVAQELLGAESRIDFVAIDASGRVTILVVGDADRDLELLARGLAQRAWVTPRVGDWLQLAPDLGARPRGGARLVLLAPRYRPETEAAAAAVGPEPVELWTYTCIRNGSGIAVLVAPAPGAARPAGAPPPPEPPPAAEPARASSVASGFRTGLDESDLGLTPAEQREFE